MATFYLEFVTDLDAAATANPTNAAWLAAKADKDLLVADFSALLTRAQNLKAAYDAVQ